MIDEVKIYAAGGNGGDGVVSFRREKYVPKGGPDGGRGGVGGSVIFVGGGAISTLEGFRQKQRYVAERGEKGRGREKTGRSGQDLYLSVPLGTVVSTGEGMEGEIIVGELVKEGQELLVAAGGEGGRGNASFTTSVNQVPRLAEWGEAGERAWVRLELRLLADVGLVGHPNTGKSTFLRAVSKAEPAVGAYPFTTLEPHLGVAAVGWREVVVADLPGLIEGAHAGRGLGHRFLRHVQRTAVLIHLVDGSDQEPLAAWEAVNRELRLFNPLLAEKPQVVVINKVDLPEAREQALAIESAFGAVGVALRFVSGLTGEGVAAVMQEAVAMVDRAWREEAERPPAAAPRILGVRPRAKRPTVVWSEGVFVVRHQRAVRLAGLTNIEHPDARAQFQRELERMGILKELELAGVTRGDIIRLGGVELEWQ